MGWGILFVLVLISCSTHPKADSLQKNFTRQDYESREFRGVWLRPPQNIEEIPQILDNIQKAGFNVLFLETLYHGYVIYPGSNFPQRPEYEGRDVLQMFIKESHKLGIAIHAWTEVFYLRVDTAKYPQFPKSPLFDKHPEWLLLTKQGQSSDVSENAHIFGDPANPSLQNFLLEFYSDLIRRYDIDGVNLDYIRYSAGSYDAGYTAWAREAYKKETGNDPKFMDMTQDPDDWMQWVRWREDRVTDFVARISDIVKKTKSEIILSASVFPEYYKNRGDHNTFQDWGSWLQKNFLDMIIPMAYASSLDSIKGEIREVMQRNSQNTWIIPALAISTKTRNEYQAPEHPSIEEQIGLIRSMKLMGHSLFCYDWILQNEKGFDSFKTVY